MRAICVGLCLRDFVLHYFEAFESSVLPTLSLVLASSVLQSDAPAPEKEIDSTTSEKKSVSSKGQEAKKFSFFGAKKNTHP
mmetsp:Transcript_32237/g.80856  ORF Transcript_32237/g.80856 Transcript_32237/m.80856 type:complete len:81 (+) Transcript_32237:240-482(+)